MLVGATRREEDSDTVFTMLDNPADLARASATLFSMLDDPADLARASAVSRSWRQFGAYQFLSLSGSDLRLPLPSYALAAQQYRSPIH